MNSQPTSSDTATWLRQADRFVKDKDYGAALEAIAKARQLDPANPYAIAYEERVRALMKADQNGPSPAGASKKEGAEGESRAAPPPLEQISHLAMQQAQSKAAASALQQHELSARKREEEERKRQEETRKAALHSKLSSFVNRAQQHLERQEFSRALEEVSRALLLDPKNSESLALEVKIRTAQEESTKRQEQERTKQAVEDERRKQEQLQAERERIQREHQERRRKEEEARRQAQRQKIEQYLDRSRSLLAEGRLQEAQHELAFVVVIDPLDPQVLSLQQQIRDAQETQMRAEMEHRRKKEEEDRKKQEATREAIQKHVDNASKLADLGNFSEALRVVTLAYVLDPLNEQIQECEARILSLQETSLRKAEADRKAQEEEQRRKAEEERQRLEHAEREQILQGNDAEAAARKREDQEKCQMHLVKAREHLARKQFEGSLAEVALAFMVDPFSEEVKQVEHEVRAAQTEYLRQQGEESSSLMSTDAPSPGELIRQHVTSAHQLREQHDYARALDELAKAFILDPLDPSIQECEDAIQTDITQQQKRDREMNPGGQSFEASLDEHFARANEFIARQSYDDALSEIALGLTLKPDDQALQELESKVWELKSRNGKHPGGSRSQDGKDGSLRAHLLAAEELLKGEEFARALDELAQAFVLDPLNAEATKLEARIRQQQSVFDKSEHKT